MYCFWFLFCEFFINLKYQKLKNTCETIFLPKTPIFSVTFVWFLEHGILKKKNHVISKLFLILTLDRG